MLAARRQIDSASTVLNRVRNVTLTIPAGAGANAWCAVALHHWSELALCDFYKNIAGMYDQIKLNFVRVNITGATNNLGASVLSNPYSCPQVVLALDRNGLNSEADYDLTTNPGEINLTPDVASRVSTYSSSRLYSWSSGNSFRVFHSIFPSSMQEKSMFVSTSDVVSLSSTADRDTDLSLPFATPTYPWKPQTLIAVRTPVVNSSGEGSSIPTTFTFTVEMNFSVTFRGLRKSPIAYSPGPGPDPDPEPLQVLIEEPRIQKYYNDGPYNPVVIDVNVPPPKLDTSIVRVGNASPEVQVVKPRTGYDGLSEVSVYNDFEPPRLESKTVAYVSNGTYRLDPSSGFDGFSNAVVDVNVPQALLYEDHVYTVSNNGLHVLQTPAGYDGLKHPSVDVQVPPYATKPLTWSATENGSFKFNDGPYTHVNLDVNVPPVINIYGVKVGVSGVATPFSDFEYADAPITLTVPASSLLIRLRYISSGSYYGLGYLATPSQSVDQAVPVGFYYKLFTSARNFSFVTSDGARVFDSFDEITDLTPTTLLFYSPFFYLEGIPVQ